ncbi:MAG: ribosome maturation factor RimM [Clostridiales bacterium]|nr:ribosome maturation factor RimM [Clostridiales bacterium]
MRINPWCDSFEFFKKFRTLYLDEKGDSCLKVRTSRKHGNVFLVSVNDIDTVEKAQALRGKTLYIRRSETELPEGHYFIAELIGCKVVDADDDSVCYGTLTQVSQTGANDVWHVTNDKGEYLIPAIPDVLIDTRVQDNLVLIRPLKGIFDNED